MFICINCSSELKDEEYECIPCGISFEPSLKKDAEYLSETKLSNII
jgi:DNA-directed RNA polymerase subunit RPC12/RpoP